VLAAVVVLWYAAAVWLNYDTAQNLADDGASRWDIVAATMQQDAQSKELINDLLKLSLQPLLLDEMLDMMLERVLSTGWLGLESKGAIFLRDAASGMLVMKAWSGLSGHVVKACARVEPGKCLCGMAAMTGKTEFASEVDERHAPHYDAATPHGHYCVPIKSPSGILGVFTLYLAAGHERDDGEIRFLESVTDLVAGIIEHKRAEDELALSRRRLQEAQALSRLGNGELDIAANKVTWSAETYRIFDMDQSIGDPSYETFLALVHPEDRGQVERLHEGSLRDGAPYHASYRLLTKGGLKYVDVRGETILGPDGRPQRVIGTTQDVTAEMTAREERDRLAEVLRQSNDSILITDLEGRMIYVNEAFERHTGYSRAEALGRKPGILKSGTLNDAVYSGLWRAISAGSHWHGHMRNKRKDGSLMEIDAVIFPIKDLSGRITAYAGVQRDMSAENELQAQLAQAQKMETLGMLASGVAHDFNNILAAIDGYAALLARQFPVGGQAAEDLGEIRKAADRASALTRQLLVFSKKKIYSPKALNLNEITAGMEKMLRRLIGDDIDLRTELAPALMNVMADPAQMEQVLLNLTVNARDAMPGGGTLVVRTANAEIGDKRTAKLMKARPGAYVLLQVSDTGSGMTSETAAKIFEPFFTTKGAGKGTGLGLSTVYGIVVKQNEGFITVDTEPGKGATFNVYLPATGAAAEPPETRGSEKRAAAAAAAVVLLVDDDPAVRAMTRRLLTENGFSVLDFSSAEEALASCVESKGRVDLLLTDIALPGMNGLQLRRSLKELQPWIRTIFVSGYADPSIIPESEELGDAVFLQKPVSIDELLAQATAIGRA
jgi:PAS domain S-box-containing protein